MRSGSSGKFRHREGKLVGRKDEEPSLSWIGMKGYRYRRTRYEKEEIIFELEPEERPEVPQGQKLMRRGFRWRDLRTVAIGLKPVLLRVKVPRWLNTTTGEEFDPPPLCRSLHENHANSGA